YYTDDPGRGVVIHYLHLSDSKENRIVSYPIHRLPETLEEFRDSIVKVVGDLKQKIDRTKYRFESASDRHPEVWSYFDFLYFSTITQTTVGYGDILPNSTTIRMFVMSQALIGLVLFVVVINLSVNAFVISH
ncbi:MAG: potassium channel family protein, partial [Gammaproteobacteria bacterium]|nr:potassium channel family protein [Gammaproteobacteria bacterium]